jgi:hypothetical protein
MLALLFIIKTKLANMLMDRACPIPTISKTLRKLQHKRIGKFVPATVPLFPLIDTLCSFIDWKTRLSLQRIEINTIRSNKFVNYVHFVDTHFHITKPLENYRLPDRDEYCTMEPKNIRFLTSTKDFKLIEKDNESNVTYLMNRILTLKLPPLGT